LVEKSGAWYSINGERMGQGRDQAKNFLKDHPEMMTDLRAKILSSKGIGQLLMTNDPENIVENEELAPEGDETPKAAAKGKKSKALN